MTEANPALAPFAEFGGDILGHKNDVRRPPDQLARYRTELGRDQVEHCGAIGRSDRNPALAGLQLRVKSQIESELVKVEAQAPVLVANKDGDTLNAQVRIPSIRAWRD